MRNRYTVPKFINYKRAFLLPILVIMFTGCSSFNYNIQPIKNLKASKTSIVFNNNKTKSLPTIIDVSKSTRANKFFLIKSHYNGKDFSVKAINLSLKKNQAIRRIEELKDDSFFSTIKREIKDIFEEEVKGNNPYCLDLDRTIERKEVKHNFRRLGVNIATPIEKDIIYTTAQKRLYKIKVLGRTFLIDNAKYNKNLILVELENKLLIYHKKKEMLFNVRKYSNNFFIHDTIISFKKENHHIVLDFTNNNFIKTKYRFLHKESFVSLPVYPKDNLMKYIYSLYTIGINKKQIEDLLNPLFRKSKLYYYDRIGGYDIYSISNKYFKDFVYIISQEQPNALKSISLIEAEGILAIDKIETDLGKFDPIEKTPDGELLFLGKFIDNKKDEQKAEIILFENEQKCFTIDGTSFYKGNLKLDGFGLVTIKKNGKKLNREKIIMDYDFLETDDNYLFFSYDYGVVVKDKSIARCLKD